MSDKYFASLILSFVVLFIIGGLVISEKISEIQNRQELILIELQDLQKKQRITSQDVDFITRIIKEGNNEN